MGHVAYFFALGISGLLTLVLAAKAEDQIFTAHAWIAFAACAIALVWRARSVNFNAPSSADGERYLDEVVRAGVIATVFWGMAGFLVGVLIAFQLAFPALNLDLPWTTFGRLRPLHTSAVVFAFGGNALICTSFYVVQRTCAARLALGMVSFGAMYFLVPKLWHRSGLYSLKLVNWHFWLATLGIVLYASSMWVSGIMQGLMWRAYGSLGFLEYSFAESVEAMHPFYIIRGLGGVLYLSGVAIMVFNLWRTAYSKTPEPATGGDETAGYDAIFNAPAN